MDAEPREECRVSRISETKRTVEGRDNLGLGLGGWSLSAHHRYDVDSNIIDYGDGTRGSNGQVVSSQLAATGGAANYPMVDFAVGPDSTLYVVRPDTGIWRKTPNGSLELWMPIVQNCTAFDVETAKLCGPAEIAVTPTGNVLVVDALNTYDQYIGVHGRRLLRITPQGVATRIAGTTAGYSGDGFRATVAKFGRICDLEAAADGSIYLLDCEHSVVRRITPEGLIETFAGTGEYSSGFYPFVAEADDARTVSLAFGSGSPQTNIWPGGIALDPSGGLYIFDLKHDYCPLRHVSPSGELTTISTRSPCNSDVHYSDKMYVDGVVDSRGDIIVLTYDGNLYRLNQKTSPVSVQRIAGDGTSQHDFSFCTATGPHPARRATPTSSAVNLGPDGRLYVMESCSGASYADDRIPQLRIGRRGEYGVTTISSDDRTEAYEFDAFGRHHYTINALTGEPTLALEYDEEGRLSALEDGDGNRTTIERDSEGVATEIIAPFGQTTVLDYDENGYLSEVSTEGEPGFEFEYTADGLMMDQTDPRGSVHVYGYDDLGRVDHDEDPDGGTYTFALSKSPGVHTVTRTSSLDRTMVYDWRRNANGSATYTVTFPTGKSNTLTQNVDGTSLATFIDGTTVATTLKPDPVFGADSFITDETITTPGARVRTQTTTRTANLAVAGDPFSLINMTENTTVNGRTRTETYTASTRTWTSVSAEGRMSAMVLDAQGRVSRVASAGTIPFEISYDEHGRVDGTQHGTDRTTDFGYDPETGFINEVENALSEVTSYTTDSIGRVTSATLPDTSVVGFDYDAESHMEGLTPPGRPEHEMTFTGADLPEDYVAPGESGPVTTHREYSLDRELTSVTQPDEEEQVYDYGSTTGLLETATIPGAGVYTFTPDVKDRLSSITTTGGFGSITFGYDGRLVTSVTTAGPQTADTWTGSIGGVVQLGYDNAFNLSSVAVQATYGGPNGFGATYHRDDDDLVTSIEPTDTESSVPTFTVERSPLDGQVETTALGIVTTARYRDVNASTPGLGDLDGLSASIDEDEIYATSYVRDDLGRITEMEEVLDGVTTTRRYEYDERGRLYRVRDGSNALISEYLYDGNGARTSAATPLQNVELGVNLGCGVALADPVDSEDRLCRYGDFEYAYDDNGRLATKTSVTTSDVTTYTYDGLGRLRAAELPGGERIDYVLDALGRRIGKVVDGDLVKGWVYGKDSLRPLAQLDEDGEIEATFVYQTGVNVPDYMVMSGGAVLRVTTTTWAAHG